MSIADSRSQSASSPSSNTTNSGISNNRTESYRPIPEFLAVPGIDLRKAARIHFDELQAYLGEQRKVPLNWRISAREKLTRLTKYQFSELSTDVYDELVRRDNNNSKTGKEEPFLPSQQNFHPKRNMARQKLATLPEPRFKDLVGDVHYELNRRYPEFKEPKLLDTSLSASPAYGDASSQATEVFPSLQSRKRSSQEQNTPFPTAPVDRRRLSEDTIRPSEHTLRPSPEDTLRPSPEDTLRLSEDTLRPSEDTLRSSIDTLRPSEDTLRSLDRSTPSARRPSGDDAISSSIGAV